MSIIQAPEEETLALFYILMIVTSLHHIFINTGATFFFFTLPPQQPTVWFWALQRHAHPGTIRTGVRWRRCGVGLSLLCVIYLETAQRQFAVVTPLIPFPYLNLIAHLKRAIITFLILSGDPRPHFLLFFPIYFNQLT